MVSEVLMAQIPLYYIIYVAQFLHFQDILNFGICHLGVTQRAKDQGHTQVLGKHTADLRVMVQWISR